MGPIINLSALHSSTDSRRVCDISPPAIDRNTGLHQVIASDDYSSLKRLLAVIAYIIQLTTSIQENNWPTCLPPPPLPELNTVRFKWIKNVVFPVKFQLSFHLSLLHGGVNNTLTALYGNNTGCLQVSSTLKDSFIAAQPVNAIMKDHILLQNKHHCPKTF